MADDSAAGSTYNFGFGDIMGLVGGLLNTWGNISAQSSYTKALKNVQAKENQIFEQMSKTTPSDQMAGIMSLYQPLSAALRNQVIQAVTAQMGARGIAGNTGIFQEALDEALAKAIFPTLQLAVSSYYQGRGQTLQALPRTIGPQPTMAQNPFAGLINLVSNRSLWNKLLPTTTPTTQQPDLPSLPDTTGDLGTVMNQGESFADLYSPSTSEAAAGFGG